MLVTCDLTDLFPRLTQSLVPHVNKFTQRFKRYLFSKWSVGKAARNDVGKESFFIYYLLMFSRGLTVVNDIVALLALPLPTV